MALNSPAIVLLCSAAAAAAPAVAAASDGARFDPNATHRAGPYRIDMREVLAAPERFIAAPDVQPDLAALDAAAPQQPAASPPGQLPPGWVQLGEVVQREEIAKGLKQVEPEPLPAWEDLEGNQYPRKGTVFLNFNGGMLLSGDDNAAENKSTLAKHKHPYPIFSGSEATALAIIQAVKDDMAAFGVRVLYAKRPHKTVPYSMAMVGGSWTDTNIGDPAGGVAPGTDCEDRNQRNVVYAFDTSSATISQEVAHGWGLDHTMGSDRIMSYQAGANKKFGDNCQALCEEACQGPGSIGCRLVHEKYCGEDSEQQNDIAELQFIFSGPDPDLEPPTVVITEPVGENDVVHAVTGADINVRADIHDNFGGVGWKLTVAKDGAVVFDKVDYDRVQGWNFEKMPNGTYEVIVEAEDHADHIVQDKVTIIVAPEVGTGGETDGETGGATGEQPTTGYDPTTGDGTGGETDGGIDTGGATSTGGQGKDDGGCRISREDGGWSGLLAPLAGLGWAAWARRRRRAV